jgi:hypothetical protein
MDMVRLVLGGSAVERSPAIGVNDVTRVAALSAEPVKLQKAKIFASRFGPLYHNHFACAEIWCE